MVYMRIKKYLDDRGIKYSYVADVIGVSKNTFSTILSGKRKITVEEYFSICSALNVDVSFFSTEKPTIVI